MKNHIRFKPLYYSMLYRIIATSITNENNLQSVTPSCIRSTTRSAPKKSK